MTASELRVRDLYGLDALRDAHLVGGASGLDSLAGEVRLVEPHDVLSADLSAGAVIVFALGGSDCTGHGTGSVHREHLFDLLLRRAHLARATALVLVGHTGDLAAATRRLADKLRIPLLLVPHGSPLELTVELQTAVRSPELEQSRLLHALGTRLRIHGDNLTQVLDAVGSALRGPVGAFTAEGVLLAGTEVTVPIRNIVAVPTLSSFRTDGTSAAVLPVTSLAGVPALWVAAERRDAGALWRQTAELALGIAHGAVQAWLAREQLAAERDARLRGTLLTEILEHGDAIPRAVSEQAAMAGWQLSGWHIGIHLQFPRDANITPFTIESVNRALADAGLRFGPLVERADGWATWVTSTKEPPADEAHRIAEILREGSARIGGRGLTVAAGIGSPQRDAAGVAATLTEARQAAVIAASSPEPVSVRVARDLGASRLLLGWYASSAFREYADQLLRPLVEASEPELLTTLEAFLDRSCSAMQTGRALGVHRNTVTQRIAKAERLLGSSLSDPDTRLALQLALRAVHTQPAR